MDQFGEIGELFHVYEIGRLAGAPVSISGGLMHKMFRVAAESGVYAVKCLNSSIMQRPGVMENMINSERIANVFAKDLPVIAALNFGGHNVLTYKGRHYMIFNWIEGNSIFPPLISKENCYEIGKALGKMHQLNILVQGIEKEDPDLPMYDWIGYGEQGREQNAVWTNAYGEIMERLILWNQRVKDSGLKLSKHNVISHRDLDPKNVMWNQERPYFIDWEAAGYVNPYQELLEVLNYWSDTGEDEPDKDKFQVLLTGYRKYMSIQDVDWESVLDSGYAGMLGWLEYSLKRALGIESTDAEERNLGAQQVVGTIAELIKYNERIPTIRAWLRET